MRPSLQNGARPWLPGPGAELEHVFDEWNVPLAGVIQQSGDLFLFTCLFGEEDDHNVWAYAPVDDDTIAFVRKFTGDALLDELDHVLANKSLVVAFADEWGLETWYTIDAGEESPAQIVQRFLSRWRISLDEQEEQVEQLSRRRELVA